MKKSALKNFERALKWEKKEIDKKVEQILLAKAEAIAEAMAEGAINGNYQQQSYVLDKLFGKARQNIGLDGGEKGTPIVFMPSVLMNKFGLDKPIPAIKEATPTYSEVIPVKSPLKIKNNNGRI